MSFGEVLKGVFEILEVVLMEVFKLIHLEEGPEEVLEMILKEVLEVVSEVAVDQLMNQDFLG